METTYGELEYNDTYTIDGDSTVYAKLQHKGEDTPEQAAVVVRLVQRNGAGY